VVATTEVRRPETGWPGLLRAAAVVDLVVVLAAGAWLRDREAVAFAVVLAVGLALLRVRSGLLGRIVLGLAFLNIEFWMLTAAVSNVTHHGRLVYVAIPVALAVASATGLVAVILRPTKVARAIAWGAMLIFVLAVGASRFPGVGENQAARPGDIRVSMKDVRFSPKGLHLRAGQVTVRSVNHDLFWHTFTVDGLGVNQRVPVGGTRATTFTARPGTYTYYCAIPGHRQAGMEGTLTIS
jgi:plastocyanin